jgi:hypothetical protein
MPHLFERFTIQRMSARHFAHSSDHRGIFLPGMRRPRWMMTQSGFILTFSFSSALLERQPQRTKRLTGLSVAAT